MKKLMMILCALMLGGQTYAGKGIGPNVAVVGIGVTLFAFVVVLKKIILVKNQANPIKNMTDVELQQALYDAICNRKHKKIEPLKQEMMDRPVKKFLYCFGEWKNLTIVHELLKGTCNDLRLDAHFCWLLQYDPSIVEKQDENGNALLRFAIAHRHIKASRYLWEWGANFIALNKAGNTPASALWHSTNIEEDKKWHEDCTDKERALYKTLGCGATPSGPTVERVDWGS